MLDMCDVFVFDYVWSCLFVLLVASVLVSMRWLLCGGDSSKKKKNNDVCNFKTKCPAREFIPITDLINSKNDKICTTHVCNYFCRDGTS